MTLVVFPAENRMPWYGIALGAVVAISLIVLDEAIASKQPILGVSSCYLCIFVCKYLKYIVQYYQVRRFRGDKDSEGLRSFLLQ